MDADYLSSFVCKGYLNCLGILFDKPYVATARALSHRKISQVVLSFIVYWQTIIAILVLFLSQLCESENMTN